MMITANDSAEKERRLRVLFSEPPIILNGNRDCLLVRQPALIDFLKTAIIINGNLDIL